MYPYYTVNHFPTFDNLYDSFLYLLLFFEFVCLCDIIIHFFLQDTDEKGVSKQEKLTVVALNYFRGKFKFDLLTFIPWGLLFTIIDDRLRFFWVIKGFRIYKLHH